MNRNLSRRSKRVEERSTLAVEPPVKRIRFISPKDMSVTSTLILSRPKGMGLGRIFLQPIAVHAYDCDA